jgi:hypothetical protein
MAQELGREPDKIRKHYREVLLPRLAPAEGGALTAREVRDHYNDLAASEMSPDKGTLDDAGLQSAL